MIVIEIREHREILEEKKGWLTGLFAPFVVDVERRVEDAIAAKIREGLADHQIRAEVSVNLDRTERLSMDSRRKG